MTDYGADEPVTVVVADDQSAVREGLVLLLGHTAGHHRRRPGGRRRRGRRAGRRDAAAGRADGPEHAGRDGVTATRADHRRLPRHPGGGAHHLRRRRVDHRRAAGRSAGVPDQGRHPGRDRPGDPRPPRPARRSSTRACSSGCSTPPSAPRRGRRRARKQPARRPAPGRRPWSRTAAGSDPGELTPREADVLRLIADGTVQPGDRADAVRLRGDGEDPRQPHLRQDRVARPGPGDPLRLHPRLRRPGLTRGARPVRPGSSSRAPGRAAGRPGRRPVRPSRRR